MKRGADDQANRPGSLLDDEDPLKNAPAPRPQRTGPRRWPRVLLGFLLVIVLLVALLPRILSLPPCRQLVLAKLNASLAPAELTVDDWSLRWFGGMSFAGLAWKDPAHHVQVQVVKVTTSGGLFGMLPAGRLNLGTITVDAPQASVELPAGTAAAAAATAAQEPAPAPRKPASAPALPAADLACRLVVQGGRIEVTRAGAPPFVLEHVKLDTEVKSVREPVALKLAAFVPWKDDAGVLSIDGTLPRPEYFLAGGSASPEHLKFAMKEVDLQGFRSLLEATTGQPWVRGGVANGSIDLAYRGREALQVQANLAVNKLSIEPPGKPVSPPGDVRLLAELDYAGGRLKVGQFSCASPWIAMQAGGEFAVAPDAGGHRTGNLEGQADVDLHTLTRDFGSVLGLRDDFRAERGRLHVGATLAGTSEALGVKVALTSSNLALRSGTELFELQPPPVVRADVTLPYEQPVEVRDLLVELPFARVTGKGRIDNATVRIGLDLAAFTKDFRRVLASCPVMTGVLEAEARTRSEAGRVVLDASATAAGVRADLQNGRLVSLNRGTLRLSGRAPVVNGRPLPDVSDITLSFESDAGSVSGSVARFVAPLSNQPPVLVDGQFKAELDLAAVRRFAGPLVPQLPADAAVGGKLVSAISAGMAGGQAKVRMNTVIQELRLLTTAWDVREDDVRLKVALDADTAARQVRIFDSRLQSRLATLEVPEWQAQLPVGDKPLSMKGGAKGQLDIAVLSGWQRAGKSGPPPKMEGKLALQAEGSGDRQGAAVTLAALLENFCLATTNGTPFREPRAELAIKATIPADGSRVGLELVSLKSSLADLDGKGTVSELKTRPAADLGGTLGVNFGNVDKLLRARGVKYPVVAGQKMRPFTLSGPVNGGAASFLSYGKGNAAVYLESAGAYGLTARAADLEAALAGGVLKVSYQPDLNQGKLVFTPLVEVTRTPMLLSFPANARVLQNVQLTQEMLDQGLVLMLPLLRGNGVLGGTVDLALEECHVPLGPSLTNDMTFSSSLTLHNLRLRPGGSLGSILDMAGYGSKEITIDQYNVTAKCSHGIVKPSDLVFRMNDSPVTLSGTVGLNGALAYQATVPLSKGLVGKELAKYVENEIVRVPITGTIAAPAVDRKALNAEINRILGEVSKKALLGTALDGLLKPKKSKKDKQQEN
jgi:hypothetical protein